MGRRRRYVKNRNQTMIWATEKQYFAKNWIARMVCEESASIWALKLTII
jgi:hypothetical protein